MTGDGETVTLFQTVEAEPRTTSLIAQVNNINVSEETKNKQTNN